MHFQEYHDYYRDEISLNKRLNALAMTLYEQYRGENTVSAQIGFSSKRGTTIMLFIVTCSLSINLSCTTCYTQNKVYRKE